MADGTAIEWSDATWNVINGCTVHSPGCANCYAMLLAATRLKNVPSRSGLARMHNGHAQWTGEVRFNEKALVEPLKWKTARKIFVCAHGDLFHEKVPDEWIDRVFAVMALAPQHQFQVLTKRADRMLRYFTQPSSVDGDGQERGREMLIYDQWVAMREAWRQAAPYSQAFEWSLRECALGSCRAAIPLPNVWLGVSVEDQLRADERIPHLLATPAAVRWLSCEPLLGPVDLQLRPSLPSLEPDFTITKRMKLARAIDWVVAGGESGRGARPMHPDWARSLRDQCAAADVPFLFKQWGQWAPDEGPPPTGRDRIFEGSAKAAVMVDGAWQHLDNAFQGPIEWCKRQDDWLFHVGKKAAGRMLDGVKHNGFPA